MTSEFLSQFESEDRVPASASLVSLQDVVGRQVVVHWDEAVAVVEELCEVAIAGGGDTAPVPELDDVLLASDGHVTLRRSRGDKSPTAAGRMLHALLSNGDVPMPLRLFVTQSTSHDKYKSLPEFARGLAYFGKPDRGRLIQDLYTRSLQTSQSSPASTTVPPPIPTSEPANEATRKEQAKRKRKPIKKWLFAAAVLGVAGGGAWLWNRGGSTQEMQGSATRMLAGAAGALADLGQQVSKALGSQVTEPAAATADSSDRSRSKPKPRPTADRIGAAEPAPIVSRRVSLPKAAGALSLTAAMPPRVDFESTAVYAQPSQKPAPEVTYSSADHDVEPPALVFPQLTPPLVRTGTSVPAMNRMVVVVSPEGTVERVQLVEGPARMVDMMLLSGAKTWKFTPAFKDGEPVRYRTVISWAVAQ